MQAHAILDTPHSPGVSNPSQIGSGTRVREVCVQLGFCAVEVGDERVQRSEGWHAVFEVGQVVGDR